MRICSQTFHILLRKRAAANWLLARIRSDFTINGPILLGRGWGRTMPRWILWLSGCYLRTVRGSGPQNVSERGWWIYPVLLRSPLNLIISELYRGSIKSLEKDKDRHRSRLRCRSSILFWRRWSLSWSGHSIHLTNVYYTREVELRVNTHI